MGLVLYVCCLCFPLRVGLLVWGYFGLVINYISIVHTICRMSDILDGSEHSDSSTYISLSLTTGALVVHFIFYIVLIAGLHKRSCTLLETFYGYSVILMILFATVMALYIPLKVYKLYPSIVFWWVVPLHLILTAIVLLLQLYLIVGVRSMISLLEEKQECSAPLYETEDQTCVLRMFNPNKKCCEEC